MTIPIGDTQMYKVYICILCNVYTVYIHLSTVCMHFHTIYLFIPNTIKMYETDIHTFWYSSFQQNCGNLATQTNTPVSTVGI